MMRPLSLVDDTSQSHPVSFFTAPAGAGDTDSAEVQGVPVSTSPELEPSIIAHYFHEVMGHSNGATNCCSVCYMYHCSSPVGHVSDVVLCLWTRCVSPNMDLPSARP